ALQPAPLDSRNEDQRHVPAAGVTARAAGASVLAGPAVRRARNAELVMEADVGARERDTVDRRLVDRAGEAGRAGRARAEPERRAGVRLDRRPVAVVQLRARHLRAVDVDVEVRAVEGAGDVVPPARL